MLYMHRNIIHSSRSVLMLSGSCFTSLSLSLSIYLPLCLCTHFIVFIVVSLDSSLVHCNRVLSFNSCSIVFPHIPIFREMNDILWASGRAREKRQTDHLRPRAEWNGTRVVLRLLSIGSRWRWTKIEYHWMFHRQCVMPVLFPSCSPPHAHTHKHILRRHRHVHTYVRCARAIPI